MNSLPVVSIGAINYNNSKFLIETLESIRTQSYGNIELIIVDDHSTDNSVQLIKEWLSGYNRPYKFIVHEKNFGVCYTCNDALKNASGKYFSLIATDDIMLPDKIKVQVEILENSDNDVAAVYSDAYLIKEDSSPRYGLFINRLRDFEDIPSGEVFDDLIVGNFLPAMSLLIKRESLKEVGMFDECLSYEDYDMWLRLASKFKIVFSDYISVKYRIRSNSLVHSIKSWNKDKIRIYAKHIDFKPSIIKQIEKFGWHAYVENNKEALELLIPFKSKSKFIKRLLLFNKLQLPKPISYRLLQKHFG